METRGGDVVWVGWRTGWRQGGLGWRIDSVEMEEWMGGRLVWWWLAVEILQ